ncbi:unnamed protein product, partial [Ectocarpus sp. 4 AP-2014]
DREELIPLIELIKLWNAKLKVVQIMAEEFLNDSQKVNKQKLISILGGTDHFFHKIDVSSSETNAIRDFVKHTESDMVAFINHKYNFFQKLTRENVVEKISFNSPVPILVLPDLR